MHPYSHMFLFAVVLQLQIGLISSQNGTCTAIDADGLLAIHLEFNTPFTCNIPGYSTTIPAIAINIPESTTFVTFQMHTHNRLLTGSLTLSPSLDTTMTNTSVGLDWIPNLDERNMEVFVSSKLEDDVMALFMAIPYNRSEDSALAPVPGACNLEFHLEDDPTLHISYDPEYQITTVDFASANVGYPRGEYEPVCDNGMPMKNRLVYEFYVRFLTLTNPSASDLFAEIERMMTVEGIEKYGKKIKTFKHKDKPFIRFMTYEGHGSIYNIIVRDPENYNRKSAYIPVVSYACNMTTNPANDSDVTCRLTSADDKGTIMLYTFIGLAGFILCYFGHRLFYLELFFFGAFPLAFGFHMVFLANTSLSNLGIAGLTALFGTIGGCSFMALWCRFGKEMFTLLLISADLGILFSAVVFFTPFGTLSAWHTTAAYGLTFTCGILIVPVMLILFPKWLCILSSAFWGSYMIVAAFSFFLGGILQYITVNIVRRASVPLYDEAYQVTPLRVIDYTLVALWPLLVLTGVLLQRKLVKGKPPLPPCPYKINKDRERNEGLVEEEQPVSPKPVEQMQRSIVDERSPLLLN